jgi:hypothetical protein
MMMALILPGGQRGDLTTQAFALGHGVRDGHEQLGEVAADLTLDADRHDRPREVVAVHAFGHGVERLLQERPSRVSVTTGAAPDPSGR